MSKIVKCLQCNKDFKTYTSEIKRGGGIYCSRFCYGSSKVGIKFSDEHRKKLSEANKGHNNSMYGKKHSKETKTRMSIASKGKPKSLKHRENISKSKIGTKLSMETLKKISGENNWNWKGGKKVLRERIRAMYQYRQWRSDIFTRDNYTCQFCGIKGGVEINADHIKSMSIILDEYKITTIDEARICAELWDINNGRTLCVSCHRKTDTWGKNLEYQKLYD